MVIMVEVYTASRNLISTFYYNQNRQESRKRASRSRQEFLRNGYVVVEVAKHIAEESE